LLQREEILKRELEEAERKAEERRKKLELIKQGAKIFFCFCRSLFSFPLKKKKNQTGLYP
jgi:hypothetical protein